MKASDWVMYNDHSGGSSFDGQCFAAGLFARSVRRTANHDASKTAPDASRTIETDCPEMSLLRDFQGWAGGIGMR
jgi:hypothetical protein